jgi:hypothetical protein
MRSPSVRRAELVAAMSPANAGRTIRIQPGVYCPKAPLTCPRARRSSAPGSWSTKGRCRRGPRGHDRRRSSPPTAGCLSATKVGLFVGNAVINLTDGSSLRGVKVSIDAARHHLRRGNTS